MSHLAKEYVGIGNKEAKTLLKGTRRHYLKYFVFTLSAIIGKLFFLSHPLFSLTEYKLINEALRGNDIDLEKALIDSTKQKKFWTAVQFVLIDQVIFIVGLILIGLIALISVQLGFLLDISLNFNQPFLFITFITLNIILFLVFILYKSVYFGPVLFFIQNEESALLHEAFSKAALVMKSGNKLKLLHIKLIYLFKFSLYLALSIAVAYYTFELLTFLWGLIVTLILTVLILRLLPKMVFSHGFATSKFFNDLQNEVAIELAYDPVALVKDTSTLKKEEILLTLFDTVSTPFKEEKEETIQDDQDKQQPKPKPKQKIEAI